MKRLITIPVVLMAIVCLWGQAPQKISYQAVIRDALDNLVTDTEVGMQISILEGSIEGTPVYIEEHSPTTNANGLIGIDIGEGTVISGDFAAIDWSAGPFYIKTETDPSGGISYSITGTSQLLSVPYALYAMDVENKDDADADSANEIQMLTIKGNDLSLSKGNTVKLPAMDTLWKGNDTTAFVLNRKVGIGIAKPAYRLDVRGAMRSFQSTSRYFVFDGRHGDGNAYINYQTPMRDGQMVFQMNGSDRMNIRSNGYVGIGTAMPAARLDVNGNLRVRGDISVDGVITGEVELDSVHVSQITGLLGQGYTMMLPDILNNYVEMDFSQIPLTENVIMVGSLGHETERISSPRGISSGGDTMYWENPGLSMEYPIVFETGNATDIASLKLWFDTEPISQVGSIIIRNLVGTETDRWNFYEYVPDSYEPGNDGRTRFKIVHNLLPNNDVDCEYAEGDFGNEHSYNPATDKLFEIGPITHSNFTPAVEVDYQRRTITITMDYHEGQGLATWSYDMAAGTENPRAGSIIETTDGTLATEISRRNYFEMIPIKYEVFYGFGQDIKLKARMVIAFGHWEDG